MSDCFVCNRIKLIATKKNPYFVVELQTGYVVLADYQTYLGYTLFLCKLHVSELHELEPMFRSQYLVEMSQVASAVYKSFLPDKLNYELLGNACPHLHWHIIPRRKTDYRPERAIWAITSAKRSYKLSKTDLAETKRKLLSTIVTNEQLSLE